MQTNIKENSWYDNVCFANETLFVAKYFSWELCLKGLPHKRHSKINISISSRKRVWASADDLIKSWKV